MTTEQPQGGSWPLANTGGPLEIYVPMVSSRRLVGIGSRAPNCPSREEGTAACPPDQSGDFLQIFTQTTGGTSPSNLIPIIGMFAREPAAPGLRLRRGRRLEVRTAPGATVTGRMGRRTLRAKANDEGVATLRLPRRARGTITVTARTVDGAVSARARRRVR